MIFVLKIFYLLICVDVKCDMIEWENENWNLNKMEVSKNKNIMNVYDKKIMSLVLLFLIK